MMDRQKMIEWLSEDGRRLIAIAIILAVLVGVWMFRYETLDPYAHRNRITGAVCSTIHECWLNSGD